MRLDLPNLVTYGGRLYVRVKRDGRARKVRIRAIPGSPEFMAEYSAALAALRSGAPQPRKQRPATEHGSLGWLAAAYFNSREFQSLARRSQAARRGVIESCLNEPMPVGRGLHMRDCPYKLVTVAHIQMLRDRKEGLPGAANTRLKYMSAIFGWAIEKQTYKVTANPCRDVRRVRYATDGYRTWSLEDVRQYVERHPRGTTAHLALMLMLLLGARRGDAIRLGPRNMRDGNMVYVPRKTSYRRLTESVKPILPPLAEAIRGTTIGLQTFLVTEYGQPFTDAGFGNKMRQWCDQAGLPECTAHGLKKAAATIVAELGATDRQMMALFDWMTAREATTYTVHARKSKLAADAAALLGSIEWDQLVNKSDGA